jgi:hypothetical protein
MNKNLLKIIVVVSAFSFVAILFNNSFIPKTKADGDEVLKEIAKYKSWTKITKDPVEVPVGNPTISG